MKLLWLLFSVGSSLVLLGCGGNEPAEFAGYERVPVPEVGQLSVPEAGGDDFAFVASEGGVLLVYFGYTSCPDVCPTTLSDVRSALAKIDEPERVELAMITVDPERDTDEVIVGYVESFVPTAHGLRTEHDSVLRAAAAEFGADYSVGVASDGEPEVAHTGSLYAVNDAGQMVLTWPFGTSSDDIGSDLELLLREAS